MPLLHIAQHQLDGVWGEVAPMIQKALDTGQGEMNASQARYALSKGMAELFVGYTDEKIDVSVLVEFINYPNYRAANIIAICGRGVLKHWDEFKQWLKFGGASVIEGHCHDSVAKLWERKLGMKKAYTIMRGEI